MKMEVVKNNFRKAEHLCLFFIITFHKYNKMKNITYLLFLTLIVTSCAQVENIAYFQDATRDMNIVRSEKYDAKIKYKDILSITVVSSEPAASSRYNLI